MRANSTDPHQDPTDIDEIKNNIIKSINSLPPNEFSYYLLLLLCEIELEDQIVNQFILLSNILAVSQALEGLFDSLKNPDDLEDVTRQLEYIRHCIDDLVHDEENITFLTRVKSILLTLIRTVSAVLFGLLGVVAGFSLGVIISPDHSLSAGLSGLQIGLVFGAFIGYAIPKKLITTSFQEKLSFCLLSLKQLNEELTLDKIDRYRPVKIEGSYHGYNAYQNETKDFIMDTFFKEVTENEREQCFNEFLSSQQAFQVCTTVSGLVDRRLDGSLGHHTLIRYKINGVFGIPPMEFGERKSLPKTVNQSDPWREVTGQKLFDMLVLDRELAETHPKNLEFTLKKFQLGSNDCLTYADKILIGTQQEPTGVRRFQPENDTWVGTKIAKPIAEYLSPIKETDLANLSKIGSRFF